jgi:hypothetical protein
MGITHALSRNSTTAEEVMAVLVERHPNTRFKCGFMGSYPVISIERFYFE